jgi:hypothetical protein
MHKLYLLHFLYNTRMIFEELTGAGAFSSDDDRYSNNRNYNANNINGISFRTYRDENIEIKYPSEWKVSEEDGLITFSSSQDASGGGAFTGDKEYDENNNRRFSDKVYGRFTVYLRETERRENKEDLLKKFKDEPYNISYGETTSNGKDAVFFITHIPTQPKIKDFFIIDKDSTYVLSYFAPIERFNESIADYMKDSFKIK